MTLTKVLERRIGLNLIQNSMEHRNIQRPSAGVSSSDTVKFNLFSLSRKEDLIPMGGIKLDNLNKVNTVRCSSIALSSEIVKNPKIFSSRCF